MTTIASPLVQSATRSSEGELQHTGETLGNEVGMFVVRVIWPIKPRGGSATPAIVPATTPSDQFMEERRGIVDHASSDTRRLRGSAYRARFRGLDVDETLYATHNPALGPSWTVRARFLRAFGLHGHVWDHVRWKPRGELDQCMVGWHLWPIREEVRRNRTAEDI